MERLVPTGACITPVDSPDTFGALYTIVSYTMGPCREGKTGSVQRRDPGRAQGLDGRGVEGILSAFVEEIWHLVVSLQEY